MVNIRLVSTDQQTANSTMYDYTLSRNPFQTRNHHINSIEHILHMDGEIFDTLPARTCL